jgi:hypothetical protein
MDYEAQKDLERDFRDARAAEEEERKEEMRDE